MVTNPPRNAWDAGSTPGWGVKIPHATEQLSPYATTTACMLLEILCALPGKMPLDATKIWCSQIKRLIDRYRKREINELNVKMVSFIWGLFYHSLKKKLKKNVPVLLNSFFKKKRVFGFFLIWPSADIWNTFLSVLYLLSKLNLKLNVLTITTRNLLKARPLFVGIFTPHHESK